MSVEGYGVRFLILIIVSVVFIYLSIRMLRALMGIVFNLFRSFFYGFVLIGLMLFLLSLMR